MDTFLPTGALSIGNDKFTLQFLEKVVNVQQRRIETVKGVILDGFWEIISQKMDTLQNRQKRTRF